MTKEFKNITIKNQLNMKKDSNAGNESLKSYKAYRKQIAKWQK